MSQRRRSSTRKRPKPAPSPEHRDLWLTLDTFWDAQRDAARAVALIRRRMCREVGELLAPRLAEDWTQETLERLSAFLVEHGVAAELASPESLARMTRIAALEATFVEDERLTAIVTPVVAPPRPAAIPPRLPDWFDCYFDEAELARIVAG